MLYAEELEVEACSRKQNDRVVCFRFLNFKIKDSLWVKPLMVFRITIGAMSSFTSDFSKLDFILSPKGGMYWDISRKPFHIKD